MKLYTFFTILLVSVLTALAFAEAEKKVKAEVKSATLYKNQAQIFLEARFDVETGQNRILIASLPGNLSADDFTIRPKGDVSITDVVYKPISGKIIPKTKEYALLEDSLNHTSEQIDSIRFVNEALAQEEKLVLANIKIGGENTGVKSTELEDVADVYRERLPVIKNLNAKNLRKIERLREKLQRLSQKIYPLQQARNKLTGELHVVLTAQTKSPAVLEIGFVSFDAGWQPSYEWKVKSLKEPMTLVYKANAYQNIGMDLAHIKLAFSNAAPTTITELPSLPVWRLQFQRAYQPAKMMREMTANYEMKKSQEEEVVDNLIQNVSENNVFSGVITEYQLNGFQNLPSDTLSHSFELKSLAVPAEFMHLSVPKNRNDVYITAFISDWESLNLEAGKALVFADNAFVGSSYLDPASTGDTLQIPLFIDKNIVVSREQINDFTSKKLIGTNKQQDYGYVITTKNNGKESIKLVVKDQIPVSGDSQISVEFTNESGAAFNQETGGLLWKINLAPTESKKTIFKYSVKYPKDKIVKGL